MTGGGQGLTGRVRLRLALKEVRHENKLFNYKTSNYIFILYIEFNINLD